MKTLLFFSILLLLLINNALFSQTKMIPFQELPTASGNPTGSNMFFGATMTTGSITVTFEGPVNRWISFGLGNAMATTDVFIFSTGHSSSSHALGWNDYFNVNYNASGVNNDQTQNWVVISTGTNTAGQRTVTASRALSTGDGNDIVVSFSATALNLVWARGASAGFSIAYHGSNDRASNILLPWQSAPTASFTTATNTVCQGSPITYINASTGGQTTYSWTFQGGTASSTTAANPVVTYSLPGTYSVSLIAANSAGSNTYSQPGYITVTPTVVPAVSITMVSTNPICQGATAVFTAAVNNGGSAPSYQWKVNGVNTGTNSATLSTSFLTNGAQVNLIMTSNANCKTANTATSSVITVTVNSNAPATVTITALPGSNPICTGNPATFTASSGNGGSSPSFQWQVNNINSGVNNATFTSSSLINGDVVNVILSSNAACASQTTSTTSGITMTVSNVLVPATSIAVASNNNPSCEGSVVTITASVVNGGNTPSFQWQVNGTNAGTNSASLASSTFSSGMVISLLLTSNFSCANPSVATSAPVTLTVHPLPQVSIVPFNTICNSDIITLSQGTPTGGTYSGNGVNGNNYNASLNGTGTFTISYLYADQNSCSNTATATIKVEECVTLMESTVASNELLVYPNPASAKISIETPGDRISAISIKNISGQIVSAFKVNQETQTFVDLSGVKEGVYILYVTTANKIMRRQITVNR